MQTELKPCPFCGGEKLIQTDNYIFCDECDSRNIKDENETLCEKLKPYESTTATGWQPIETAPTDNKRLLYLARFDEDNNLIELDFNGGWEYWEESWEMPHINGYCWVSQNGIENPTHWAYQDEPLPTKQLST